MTAQQVRAITKNANTVLTAKATTVSRTENALNLFGAVSKQLTETYHLLETRVAELQHEIISIDQQRLNELAAKEKLANRLQGLLEMLPAGVVILDARGVVQETNAAAADLLQQSTDGSPQVLVGEKWIDIIRRAFAPKPDDGHEMSLVDGRRVKIDTQPLPNEPGQIILLTDMTETRELQTHLSHAQRLSEMGKMVASLAHQIRTPLSAAILYCVNLKESRLGQDKRLRFAEKLFDRLKHIEHQIRDMLIFSRGELPRKELVSVTQLLEDTCRSLENCSQAYEVQLTCNTTWIEQAEIAQNSFIHGNFDALQGALTNLIENAFQASSNHACNKIQLNASLLDCHWVKIAVIDNGPGIPQEQLEQIFEPFFTTKSTGTGLGLAVVKAIVEAHGGRIAVSSKLTVENESETCFELVLPLSAAA